MDLGIERVTAADANEPLVDEYVYLAGRPPLRDYIHFMMGAIRKHGRWAGAHRRLARGERAYQ
jgi:hypothetical protein